MMSMLTTLNEKSEWSEEQLGQGGRLMPVAEATMDHGHSDHGGEADECNSCKEEEDALELQQQL